MGCKNEAFTSLYIGLTFEPRLNAVQIKCFTVKLGSGIFRSVVVDCSPSFTFSSYTKIVKRIGLYKWSGGVHGALFLFILSKLFHIDDIWYICNEINTVYYE